MDPNLKTPIKQQGQHNITTIPTTTSLHRYRRKTLLKRRKLPSARLGGNKSHKSTITRIFRRVRLRWLKLKYVFLLRKLKKYYKELIKDIVEGSAAFDTQQRVFMEASFGHPVMGIAI